MNIDHSGFVVIGKIKSTLTKKGTQLLRSLSCYFDKADTNQKPRLITQESFFSSLRSLGVELNHDDAKGLIKALDTEVENLLDYDRFIEEMRGRMNPKRQAVVDLSFMKFDPQRIGCITVKDLQGKYNFKIHPKVQSHEWQELDVFMEFIEHFYEVKKEFNNPSGPLEQNIDKARISRTEWDDYYSVVSMMVSDDEIFVDLMTTNWNLR